MKFLSFLVTLVIGIAFGVGVTLFAPDLVGKYIPSDVGGSLKNIEGTVVAKQRKDRELLITINTPEGAMLATFKKNLDKIDLLVSVNDTMEIKITGYRPFIDDPIIARVRKPETLPGKQVRPEVSSQPSGQTAEPETVPRKDQEMKEEESPQPSVLPEDNPVTEQPESKETPEEEIKIPQGEPL